MRKKTFNVRCRKPLTRSIIQSLTVLVCLTSNLWAQEEESPRVRDGLWWRKGAARDQNAYVIGMMDGVNSSLWFVWQSGLTKQEYEALGSRMATAMNGLRSDTIADGLTSFYEDVRNRRIPLFSAVWVVCLQLRGAPAEQIERDVAFLRSRSGKADN